MPATSAPSWSASGAAEGARAGDADGGSAVALGGDTVAREVIRTAVGKVYSSYFEGANMSQIIQWFDMGGSVRLDESLPSADVIAQLNGIQGLLEKTGQLGLGSKESDALRVSAAEFILEGLYGHRRIARSEEREFSAGERKREASPQEEARKSRRQYQ